MNRVTVTVTAEHDERDEEHGCVRVTASVQSGGKTFRGLGAVCTPCPWENFVNALHAEAKRAVTDLNQQLDEELRAYEEASAELAKLPALIEEQLAPLVDAIKEKRST